MYDKRPRLAPSSYIGQRRCFLTFCVDARHHAFVDAARILSVWLEFLRAATECDVAILAYVFMPDHVHLLVEGRSVGSDLRTFSGLAKQYSGYRYSTAIGRRLWQPSYYDRLLRDEEATWDVIAYICANPLRKQLATNCAEYEFLGSGTMTREELLQGLSVHTGQP